MGDQDVKRRIEYIYKKKKKKFPERRREGQVSEIEE